MLNWIRTSDPAGTVMVPVLNAYPRATSSISTGPAGAVVAGTAVSTGDGEVGSPVVDVGVTEGDVGSAVCVVGTIVGVGVTRSRAGRAAGEEQAGNGQQDEYGERYMVSHTG